MSQERVELVRPMLEMFARRERRNNTRPGVFDMRPGVFAINSGFVLEEAGRTPTMEISTDRGLQR
jgi:hypothetical protein